MFRDVARVKQKLTKEESIALLERTPRGILSVLGDGDYPYGMPLNHWYDKENGRLYFHGGRAGHKIDAIKRHDKVSFCVMDEGERKDGEWWLTFKSVIVFGRVRLMEDHDRAIDISRRLSLKFTEDEKYIEDEVRHSGAGVLCFELIPEHITGKIVREK